MTRSILVRRLAPAIGLLLLAAGAARSQSVAAQPQFKGVFEPVSFTEDIDFLQVVFVTPDVGWVAGEHGTIIHTKDGGKTWEAQLGGDPADRADQISVLHFLDERRGWAIQGLKTLRTRDGESWEEIGSAPYVVNTMAFTSPRTGFLAGSPHITQRGPTTIYRTTDGGRSWKPVWTCAAKITLGGLTKNIECQIEQIQFPSPKVGYAVVTTGCMGTCGGPPMLAKTTDGGDTWQIMMGPGVVEEDLVSGLLFLDDNTGFVRLDSKKLHVTTDGGATWRGIVASPGKDIQFADPSVGWAIELGWTDLKWTYTADGGKRWTSRQLKLPATTRAFSLPRRDRGYVVGDHGMVFRYRVVPAAAPMVANAVAAPAMPAFETQLGEQVAQLEQVVREIGTELDASAAQPRQSGTGSHAGGISADSVAAAASADSLIAFTEPFDAPLPAPSGYTASCCRKSFNRLDVLLGALSQSLPDFIGKYRNLNLLLAALRMSSELPNEYRSLRGGLRTFRRAQDRESAQAALATVLQALSAFKQTTSVSMQQQLPPVPSSDMDAASSAGNGTFVQSPSSAAPVPPGSPRSGASGTVADSVKAAVKDAGKDAAKDAAKGAAGKVRKGLGGLLPKKP